MDKIKCLTNKIEDNIFDDVIMIDNVDFLTKEQTKQIILRAKQGIKELNNPDKWLTWEECTRRLDEECFNDSI